MHMHTGDAIHSLATGFTLLHGKLVNMDANNAGFRHSRKK